ncbi:hypothetical protein MP228_009637 [Amoeboaphelidium protococcarum]|nr:hypothetical protein MP228_009637 [Amoeboaphelidium protococcarum]
MSTTQSIAASIRDAYQYLHTLMSSSTGDNILQVFNIASDFEIVQRRPSVMGDDQGYDENDQLPPLSARSQHVVVIKRRMKQLDALYTQGPHNPFYIDLIKSQQQQSLQGQQQQLQQKFGNIHNNSSGRSDDIYTNTRVKMIADDNNLTAYSGSNQLNSTAILPPQPQRMNSIKFGPRFGKDDRRSAPPFAFRPSDSLDAQIFTQFNLMDQDQTLQSQAQQLI